MPRQHRETRRHTYLRLVLLGLALASGAALVSASCGSTAASTTSEPALPASTTTSAPPPTTALTQAPTTTAAAPTSTPTAATTTTTAAGTPVRLTWFGQSAFLLEASDGTRIILDPYRPSAGGLRYAPIAEAADAVVVTHDHSDHNAVDEISGDPRVFQQPAEATIGTVKITGIPSFHDDQGGAARGANTIVALDDGTLRIVHLGDLGGPLNREQIRAIGRVDVLLVPVGGTYTIDAATALEQVLALAPRVVVPMHYKTAKVDLPLMPVDDFLSRAEHAGLTVRRVSGSSLQLSPATLPTTTEILMLEPAR